jgi:hypothetical protein
MDESTELGWTTLDSKNSCVSGRIEAVKQEIEYEKDCIDFLAIGFYVKGEPDECV